MVSDLRPDASSNRGYDLTSPSARIHHYRPSGAGFRYHEKRSRSDYSPQENGANGNQNAGANDDLSGYLKTAASETSHAEQSAQSSGSFIPTRTVAVRRKPTYADKQYEEPQSSSYSFSDPSLSKHFLKTHFRDTDYSGSSLMETGEQVSASNDNELAQLAATMSELQSSPTSTPEMFSQADLSQLEAQGYSGSLGSLGAASINSPMPANGAVPGTVGDTCQLSGAQKKSFFSH